ncbi:MAG: hypothetical protein M3323_00685 [Actinomycetota bacterium]|nr:hypothetical protein [Actinomycetota bacterium]
MKSFRPMVLVLVLVIVALSAACGGDDEGGGSAQAFCDNQEEMDAIDTADPEAMAEAIDELAADAPDEISDDVQLIADTLQDLDEVDTPEEAEALNSSELQEASERIEEWVDENCEEG